MKYILAIDQGTTSSRTIIFNSNFEIVSIAQKEFTQYFPQVGWVEHDANEIWETQYLTILSALDKASLRINDIACIGITNQRETTVVWDKSTGEPLHRAIVWQDRRTADYCNNLKKESFAHYITEHTGLIIDAYFSASKLKWLIDNNQHIQHKINENNVCFGTIDSWIMYKLSQGTIHATDYSNASRTMLFNIDTLTWDEQILNHLQIPSSVLPQVFPSSHYFGDAIINGINIPICGVAGDQQAALFGQSCFHPGDAKNTYGTGCFMLMNTGDKKIESKNGLITTIAWGIDNKITYALEGSVFIAGAAVQWLRDEMKVLENAKESEEIATSVPDNAGVVMVPAFAGLGAPYWDMYAQGAIFGLTRGTKRAHIIRAVLESLAYQTRDVLNAMQQDANIKLASLNVDGGACANNFLMQFQCDMLQTDVVRPTIQESTAFGAAMLAALQKKIVTVSDIKNQKKIDRKFTSKMPKAEAEVLYKKWQKAVHRVMNWNKEE